MFGTEKIRMRMALDRVRGRKDIATIKQRATLVDDSLTTFVKSLSSEKPDIR